MTAFRKAAGTATALMLIGSGAFTLAASSPVLDVPRERLGNPLWVIPLAQLAATRERPIFSPSRRPPPPAMVAAPPVPPPAPPPAPSAPLSPPLTLVGTIAGEHGGYGIFLDQATNTVTHLRVGEVHEGWTLKAVSVRDAMLQKDNSTAMLTLPGREGEQAGAPRPHLADVPASGARAAGASPSTAPPAGARPPSKVEPIFYPEH